MGQYIRHAIASIDEILEAVRAGYGQEDAKHTVDGYTFNVHSLRLKTFLQHKRHTGIHCKACGLKASFFSVDSFARQSDLPSVHVNLYGVSGDKEILFTRDHKVPKAKGGGDGLNNSQVMCQPCNSKKGSKDNSKFLKSVRVKNECLG